MASFVVVNKAESRRRHSSINNGAVPLEESMVYFAVKFLKECIFFAGIFDIRVKLRFTVNLTGSQLEFKRGFEVLNACEDFNELIEFVD